MGRIQHQQDGSITALGDQTKARSVLAILDVGPTATTGTDDKARDDEMTGIPDNVAFQTYVILRLSRLGRFVRWVDGLGVRNPKPADVISWWGPIVMNGNVEQTGLESIRDICPVDIVEAEETRRCIIALPQHLFETVIQEYVVCGKQAQKAHALDIDVSTFRRRLTVAHAVLLDLFNAAAAGLPLEANYPSPGRPKKP